MKPERSHSSLVLVFNPRDLYCLRYNNNNNNHDSICDVIIMTEVIATERWVAANPQTKPIDLGCESAKNWQLPSTSTVAIVIITQLYLSDILHSATSTCSRCVLVIQQRAVYRRRQ